MNRRRFSWQEIQMLQDRFPMEGPVQLAEELGRTEDSVSSFARRCGLRTQRRPYRKTNEVTSNRAQTIPEESDSVPSFPGQVADLHQVLND